MESGVRIAATTYSHKDKPPPYNFDRTKRLMEQTAAEYSREIRNMKQTHRREMERSMLSYTQRMHEIEISRRQALAQLRPTEAIDRERRKDPISLSDMYNTLSLSTKYLQQSLDVRGGGAKYDTHVKAETSYKVGIQPPTVKETQQKKVNVDQGRPKILNDSKHNRQGKIFFVPELIEDPAKRRAHRLIRYSQLPEPQSYRVEAKAIRPNQLMGPSTNIVTLSIDSESMKISFDKPTVEKDAVKKKKDADGHQNEPVLHRQSLVFGDSQKESVPGEKSKCGFESKIKIDVQIPQMGDEEPEETAPPLTVEKESAKFVRELTKALQTSSSSNRNSSKEKQLKIPQMDNITEEEEGEEEKDATAATLSTDVQKKMKRTIRRSILQKYGGPPLDTIAEARPRHEARTERPQFVGAVKRPAGRKPIPVQDTKLSRTPALSVQNNQQPVHHLKFSRTGQPKLYTAASEENNRPNEDVKTKAPNKLSSSSELAKSGSGTGDNNNSQSDQNGEIDAVDVVSQYNQKEVLKTVASKIAANSGNSTDHDHMLSVERGSGFNPRYPGGKVTLKEIREVAQNHRVKPSPAEDETESDAKATPRTAATSEISSGSGDSPKSRQKTAKKQLFCKHGRSPDECPNCDSVKEVAKVMQDQVDRYQAFKRSLKMKKLMADRLKGFYGKTPLSTQEKHQLEESMTTPKYPVAYRNSHKLGVPSVAGGAFFSNDYLSAGSRSEIRVVYDDNASSTKSQSLRPALKRSRHDELAAAENKPSESDAGQKQVRFSDSDSVVEFAVSNSQGGGKVKRKDMDKVLEVSQKRRAAAAQLIKRLIT